MRKLLPASVLAAASLAAALSVAACQRSGGQSPPASPGGSGSPSAPSGQQRQGRNTSEPAPGTSLPPLGTPQQGPSGASLPPLN